MYDGHSRHAQLELSWLSIQNAHHAVDWDSTNILNRQPILQQRLVLESSHIRAHARSLSLLCPVL